MQTTLDDFLRHNVQHYGNRIAVTIDDAARTHAQLAQMVDQARSLGTLIEPGDRVALWLPNSFAWIASFLAVTSLGGVLVPVNTRLTGAELAVILADAGVRVLITVTDYRGRNYLEEAQAVGGSLVDGMIVSARQRRAAVRVESLAWRRALRPRRACRRRRTCCASSTRPARRRSRKGAMLTNRAYLQTAAYVARCQRLTPNSAAS